MEDPSIDVSASAGDSDISSQLEKSSNMFSQVFIVKCILISFNSHVFTA
jgi:hypothetical protein